MNKCTPPSIMKTTNNIWKNDQGFIWMLVISVLALISTQLDVGLVGESKLLLRLGFFLVTLIAINSSSLTRISKSIGYLIACLMLLSALLMIKTESQSLILLYSILSTGYMLFILWLIINQIFTGGIITLNKIFGGVAAYILLGHLWSSIYHTLYLINPASFQYAGETIQTTGEALKLLSYFSFVTLTTIGYGDILALSSEARVLVMLEGLIGQLFPAIFIAKLVALQIEHSRKS
jgi:hypothetical protein